MAGDFDFGSEANTKVLLFLRGCCVVSFSLSFQFIYDDLVLNFLGRHLWDQNDERISPVNLFLMGENRWLQFNSWPPPCHYMRFALAQKRSFFCLCFFYFHFSFQSAL